MRTEFHAEIQNAKLAPCHDFVDIAWRLGVCDDFDFCFLRTHTGEAQGSCHVHISRKQLDGLQCRAFQDDLRLRYVTGLPLFEAVRALKGTGRLGGGKGHLLQLVPNCPNGVYASQSP